MRVHLPAEDMSIGICSSRQYPRQSGSSINYLPSILNWVPWRHQFFPRKCQFGKVSSITPRDFSTFQAKGSQWQDIHLCPRWQHRCRLHMRMFKPKKEPLNTTEKVLELLQPVRYKPTSVDEMAEVRSTYNLQHTHKWNNHNHQKWFVHDL